jgi:hypothetical protein
MAKVTGRIISATITGSGKNYRVKMDSKYGSIVQPFYSDPKSKEKAAIKLIGDIIPKSKFAGMIDNKAIFIAPENWKGGVNA